jgi:hypothetical protein
MIPNEIKVTFPAEFRRTYGHPCKYNKVEVIKAIRMLTGWGLVESKDVSESQYDNLKLPIYTGILQSTYNEALEMFRNNGVTVENDKNNFHTDLLNTLEKLSVDAIHAKEYSISIRILEFMNTLK